MRHDTEQGGIFGAGFPRAPEKEVEAAGQKEIGQNFRARRNRGERRFLIQRSIAVRQGKFEFCEIDVQFERKRTQSNNRSRKDDGFVCKVFPPAKKFSFLSFCGAYRRQEQGKKDVNGQNSPDEFPRRKFSRQKPVVSNKEYIISMGP